MPIRLSPSNRSVTASSTSAHTRATTAPTVRQAMRINCDSAVLEVWVANQATCSSKT